MGESKKKTEGQMGSRKSRRLSYPANWHAFSQPFFNSHRQKRVSKSNRFWTKSASSCAIVFSLNISRLRDQEMRSERQKWLFRFGREKVLVTFTIEVKFCLCEK